jgi:hypothetical protein
MRELTLGAVFLRVAEAESDLFSKSVISPRDKRPWTDLPLALSKISCIRRCQTRQVTVTLVLEPADYHK